MSNLSIENCRLLAHARREKGLTQSALAERVGCKQSAISMLESGQPEKLSKENTEKLAKLLGVTLKTTNSEDSAADRPGPLASAGSGYCPNAHCPSCVPYPLQDSVAFWPRLQSLSNGRHCAYCGDLIETSCPECKTPVQIAGACCTVCGAVRIANTLPVGTPPESWIMKRRDELQTFHQLINEKM